MIKQGAIFWANLSPVKGSEQAGQRLVLVLQNNPLNQNLNTVLIAPLTTNLKAKGRLTTYFLDKRRTNLKKDSVALLFQLRCIDRSRLLNEQCQLNRDEFLAIKAQISLLF